VSKQELVAKAEFAIHQGARVSITGAWVWATFADKPSREVRAVLKAEGFRWSKGKGKWYFAGRPCASRTSHSWGYIVQKYGEEELVPA